MLMSFNFYVLKLWHLSGLGNEFAGESEFGISVALRDLAFNFWICIFCHYLCTSGHRPVMLTGMDGARLEDKKRGLTASCRENQTDGNCRLKDKCPLVSAQVAGRTWHLRKPGNLDDLWEAMAVNNPDERLPYWVELWPSSLVLAEWLFSRKDEIANKCCLDVGCGLGLTAMLGAWLGADMLAMDYEFDALEFCRHNSKINHVRQVTWLLMDWRKPAFSRACIWRAWAGDVMYEKRFIAPLLDFLSFVLAPTGKIWIAEPGRKIFDLFVEQAIARGLQANVVYEREKVADFSGGIVHARVWELKKDS